MCQSGEAASQRLAGVAERRQEQRQGEGGAVLDPERCGPRQHCRPPAALPELPGGGQAAQQPEQIEVHHGQPLEQEQRVRQIGPGRRFAGGPAGQQAAEDEKISGVTGAHEQLQQQEEGEQVSAGEAVEGAADDDPERRVGQVVPHRRQAHAEERIEHREGCGVGIDASGPALGHAEVEHRVVAAERGHEGERHRRHGDGPRGPGGARAAVQCQQACQADAHPQEIGEPEPGGRSRVATQVRILERISEAEKVCQVGQHGQRQKHGAGEIHHAGGGQARHGCYLRACPERLQPRPGPPPPFGVRRHVGALDSRVAGAGILLCAPRRSRLFCPARPAPIQSGVVPPHSGPSCRRI